MTPELLIEETEPVDGAALSPAKLMEAVLDMITERTNRTFKKKGRWAKELLDKANPPADLDHLEDCEVFDRLTAKEKKGWKETMENLLTTGPRQKEKKI